MAVVAKTCAHSRRMARPKKNSNAAPANGSSGMRRRLYSISALHQGDFVQVHGLAGAEDAHENGQPHRRLGGRQGDDEEGEDVALLIAEGPGERQKSQVPGVEL